MRFYLLIILTLTSFLSFSQDLSKDQLDSLFNLYIKNRGLSSLGESYQTTHSNSEIIKCGLGIVTSIKQNHNNFSPEQQNVLAKILQRPVMQNSAVTSNGYFRVHYDVSGYNAIGYDINLLLQALDSVYNFEITYLSYPLPPADGSEGGDDKYDIYVVNLGSTYGQTTWETKVGNSNWTSYIEIDNDFPWYSYENPPKQPINAARVTVAHEFHHSIQLGSYADFGNDVRPLRDEDRSFFEITSTSFEEFVFDDVNDYYYYLDYYFNNPERPVLNTSLGGYDIAIWNLFLEKKFGFGIFKKQWELMPTNRAIKSIALSLADYSTTLGNELNRFGVWCYYTGNRNLFPGLYFEEADSYPELDPTASMIFNSNSQTYNMSVNPTANYFFKINLQQTGDEFFTIITNSDWQQAINDDGEMQNFSFSVFNDSASGNRVLSENYSVTFNQENQTYWNNAGILNNIVIYGDTSYNIPEIESETFAYPNPYRTSSSNNIKIAFQSNLIKGEEIDINIFSSGLEQILSQKTSVISSYLKSGKKFCEIVLDGNKIDFPSGVYLYAIKSGKEIWKGKLVIFND